LKLRVIGIGQKLRGDDGVGIEVVRVLREEGVPPDVDLIVEADPANLPPLLENFDRILIVDAVAVLEGVGDVFLKAPEDFQSEKPVSSHLMTIPDAVGLARVLYEDTVAPTIEILGIGVEGSRRFDSELSEPVCAAIPRAIERLRTWIGES
jgi:hydrogenase maturation protease